MTAGTSPPFQLTLPAFAGTIDEILRAVAQKKLSAADVLVGGLTAQLHNRVQSAEELNLDEAGEIMAGCARLLLIKSGQLLIQRVEEEDEPPSSPSLRITDSLGFQEATALLAGREGLESFAPLAAPNLVERPLKPRSPAALARTWAEMQERAARARARVAVPAFVRLETAVSGLIRRLRAQSSLSFKSLLRGASRQDAVVHFLAVLELVRRRQASADQPEPFDDITVEYAERVEDEAIRAG